ncbi:MAG TPA: hemerythrin domain-containing protein [Armatimonadota bacterium]|nr:hemerythrin domain-containing protein [Armatimonadota bacterium]
MDASLPGQAVLGDVLTSSPGGVVSDAFSYQPAAGAPESLAAARAVTAPTPKAPSETALALVALVAHISSEDHNGYWERLPVLKFMAAKVRQAEAPSHPEYLEFLSLFDEFYDLLEGHMRKEESMVFPLLRQQDRSGAHEERVPAALIQYFTEIRAEHQQLEEVLGGLAILSHNYTLPPNCPLGYRTLLESMGPFHAELLEHIKEENQLLDRFSNGILSDAAGAAERGE